MSIDSGGLELVDFKTVLLQKGSCYPSPRVQAAGWTPGFEHAAVNILLKGDGKYHSGSAYKWFGEVYTVVCDNPCLTSKDGMTVATGQVGWRSRCGETTQLLRTNRNPVAVVDGPEAIGAGLALAIVPGTKAGKTCTDKIFFMNNRHH